MRSFMFPFVQTAEEATLAVQSTRYPPAGMRGYSGGTAPRIGAATVGRRTGTICVIIQIESPRRSPTFKYGTVDGIDAMLIGANDLQHHRRRSRHA